MKPVLLYGLLAALFLSFGSCKNTDDEFLHNDVLPPVPEGYIRMQISVPGLTPVSTYALGTADETHVSEVGVLVFGSDSKYLCYAAVTEPSKIIGAGSTKTFDVDLRAAGNIASAYAMVVANVAVDTVGFAASQPTKETVMQSMTFSSSGKWNATGSSNFTPFPMWGMTPAPVSLATASSIPSISLLRSVARIDVGLKFPDNVTDGTETAAGLGSTFTLEEVYLYNSLNKGSIAPYSGNYTGTTVTAPSIPTPAPGTNNSPVPSYLSSNGAADGFNANKFSCTGAIYMAEHAAGSDALSDNPYLVIGGKYNGSGTVTYYRLDFVSGNYPDQEFLPVLRNHRYRFNITGVAGPGYGSIDLAKSSRPVNFTYDLSATDESLASYVYDGQYALGVSQDSYTFDRDGKPGNSLKISATFGKYNAVINPVAPTNNIDWLMDVTGAGDKTATFGELTFNVSANDSGGERSAKIVIASGLLTKEVTVRQSNKAGFNVELASGTHYTSYNKKTVTVTSSYDWCVNVSDSHGIITQFDAKGTSSTNTFSFTPKASSYYALTEASFTFFSPTGEFDPVTKTISVPASSGQYLPSSHGGWAGSNIYWDQSLRGGNGALTFDDTNNRANEAYQGVFFKWGSLYGLDPGYQGSTSWGNNCKVYVPNWNYTNPTASTWTNTTVGSTYTWGNIPYAEGQTNETEQKYAYLTMDAGAIATDNTVNGGHVPVKDKSVAGQKMKGDICRYLTQTGDAPGSLTGTRWRMPTAAEFASPTTASPAIASTTDYNLVGTFLGSGSLTTGTDATGKWKVTYSSTYPGRRKQYSHIWTASASAEPFKLATADQPFFSVAGDRRANGLLELVGYQGLYCSSSSNGANTYALWFPDTNVYPDHIASRQYGFSVRCVKE